MDSRRDFIKKASLLAGVFGFQNAVPEAIQRALAIEPVAGSSFLDAEHIVLLMQENRSFDHSFGTLRGVRGFNDPRAIRLPSGNPVWLQSSDSGTTYSPFRLDIKNSNAAWTGNLPHSWENQMAARNKGKHDNWIEAKRPGGKVLSEIPLTMGYYTREDIPFYYALADAFTICDQHFCSSITGTTTNRHFFWTGTCVPEPGAKPLVRNSDIYFNRWAHWKTYPERLEEAGITWKVYQNEVSMESGLDGEELLGNFTDNNLEWFAQYHIGFKKSHLEFMRKRVAELPAEIQEIERSLSAGTAESVQKSKNKLKQKQEQLKSYSAKLNRFAEDAYQQLPRSQRALHEKAFQTNEADPYYRETTTVTHEGEQIKVPKGDVLYQFRKDVASGHLPTVSWLVAPQCFSDHPSAPMYGAWYVSEILNILTENPEVWKKTIFILNYDENDGYFDHVPPFVAPDPADPRSGKTSAGLDYSGEYVSLEQELADGEKKENATEGPVGLGYRVPLIVASPWSRGGWVNSEVCDITSTIQFMEYFFAHKLGKQVEESNISSWRRAITGNLTSVFRKADAVDPVDLPFLDRNQQIYDIDRAKAKPLPNNFHVWTAEDMEKLRSLGHSDLLARQEKGQKNSSALAYELYSDATVDATGGKIAITMRAGNKVFGSQSLNSPFNVYSGSGYKDGVSFWPFAVVAGESLNFEWDLADFKEGYYDLTVYGPNGFMRGFKGKNEPLSVVATYEIGKKGVPTGNVIVEVSNQGEKPLPVQIKDNAYSSWKKNAVVGAGRSVRWIVESHQVEGWYDVSVQISGSQYVRQFAGRVETGKHSKTDPQLG
ncbi:phosphocholine-specific phospholipase C [Sphingobacterium thalpophilum]|uniref:phospholipase C n=1 Tax=Sphingobacterium thalpophilum TaxID=259 RepID=A0A4U9UK23_9SPHI|nr:phospholipase C, phosphocholine-specific [Sphingobacterium thalpophilum]VTR33686.1 Non-hemolytic phospholipase C precursor [Sphingobacterium thalpophilum]